MREEHIAKEYAKLDANTANGVYDNWYPTIFFFDLQKNCVVWEIFGAEQFIKVDEKTNVYVLTNEVWTYLKEDDYEKLKEENPDDFTRHWEFDSYIWRIKYDTDPYGDELDDRLIKAPEVPTVNSYKLTFGNNKTLEITEGTKLVEAYMH